jgi:hypothetical protein
MSNLLELSAIFLVTLTALLLLTIRDWRWGILALAVQYVGVIVLVALSWPLEIALVKIVAGWMAGAVLGLAMANAPEMWRGEEHSWPSGRLFRLLTAGLTWLVVISLVPRITSWVPGIDRSVAWGGLTLISFGLLHLALTTQPLRVALGLLTLLSGFEILYAAVQTSTLVAGLLATVNIAIALTGAYLIIAPGMEKAE